MRSILLAISFSSAFFFLHSVFLYGEMLQDFEDGVLWIAGGNQDTKGYNRGWAFTHSSDPDDRIEIDNIGANGTKHSLKVTFAGEDNDQIYFRSDDKLKDHMPEAQGANRMSFYLRFEEDFPIQPQPFRYDTWQLGTYIHDPNDWADLHWATFEEDHGYHHYYHRLTIEQVGDGWVKYIVTTKPDQATYSGSDVPPDIPYYFDNFGRFYFHFGPGAGGPNPERPFTVWIDEINFYYDDGSIGGEIHIGGQDDEGFDGQWIPDFLNQDVNQDRSVNISDVQVIINVILGSVINSRADVDGDGSVTIQDVQGVVNVILAGTQG